MKKITVVLIFLSLISCKKNESTTNETEAVQQVLNFYNGECKKSQGVIFKNGENESFFELEMSKSELLNSDSNNLKSHSANIAYLFFSNLNEKVYDDIKVKINLSNGQSQEFSYSNDELIEIKKIEPFLKKIITQIISKDYIELKKSFDKTVNVNSNSLENIFNKVEKEYGLIKKNQFQGFEFKKAKQFGDVIVIKEALIFEKIALKMNIILKKNDSKIIALEFE
nr:hypothetical protein [Flavobacterium sp. ASV13]